MVYHHGLVAMDIFYFNSEQSLLSSRFGGITDRVHRGSIRGVCEVCVPEKRLPILYGGQMPLIQVLRANIISVSFL